MLSSIISSVPLSPSEYLNLKVPLEIWFQIVCLTDHLGAMSLLKVSKGLLTLLERTLNVRAHKVDTIYINNHRLLSIGEFWYRKELTRHLSEEYIMSHGHLVTAPVFGRRSISPKLLDRILEECTLSQRIKLLKEGDIGTLESVNPKHMDLFREYYPYNKGFNWDLYPKETTNFAFTISEDSALNNPKTPWDVLKDIDTSKSSWYNLLIVHPNTPFEVVKRLTWGRRNVMVKVCKSRAVTLEYLEEALKLLSQTGCSNILAIKDPSLLPQEVIINKLERPLSTLLGLSLERVGLYSCVPLVPFMTYIRESIPHGIFPKLLRKRLLTLEELDWLWSLRYEFIPSYTEDFWSNVSINRSFGDNEVLKRIHYNWKLETLAFNSSITLSGWIRIFNLKG